LIRHCYKTSAEKPPCHPLWREAPDPIIPIRYLDNQALALSDALHERRKDNQLPEVLKAPLHLRVF
jgi:hypothetical protein